MDYFVAYAPRNDTKLVIASPKGVAIYDVIGELYDYHLMERKRNSCR